MKVPNIPMKTFGKRAYYYFAAKPEIMTKARELGIDTNTVAENALIEAIKIIGKKCPTCGQEVKGEVEQNAGSKKR